MRHTGFHLNTKPAPYADNKPCTEQSLALCCPYIKRNKFLILENHSMKTLILGASPKPNRYAYRAAERLLGKGHEIVLLGNKKEATALEHPIHTDAQPWPDIDTVTLYLRPSRQEQYYNYLLELAPRRIIFNPGTENPELRRLAQQAGIETVEGCTLVMLNVGNY